MGLTATEAAPLMGVGASTVGSYRQRAYQKLGVATKADFLRMPACELWQKTLAQEDTQGDESAEAVPQQAIQRDSRDDDKSASASVSRTSYFRLFMKCLLAGLLIVSAFVVLSVILRPQPSYVDSPNGYISSEYGDVPDVTGMRADAAAAALASAGYYPEFLPQASSDAPGTTLDVGEIGDMKDADENRAAIAWDGGSASGYNLSGDWKAYVLLEVAV
jgi:hypothetical protein